MEREITREKLNHYFKLTEEALRIVKKKIVSGSERQAKEIIQMASNYLSDARYFLEQGNWVNCFGALNYAHGWIDSGVRLGIFDVDDNKLFTIK
jgi:hypothetical protein